MSINVTVTGNPVSIKRGTMVTGDPDYAKKEFDRRRKIRLAQVRQQSNNIAETVRKKVRKEKDKQLSEIEQRGADKLEKWKTRKMLELQEQYCESLKDLGLGHAQAVVEETRDEITDAYKGTLNEKSKHRGQEAAKKMHREQQEKLQKQAAEKQRRMLAKSVENFRVEKKTKKSPFRKKKKYKNQGKSNISGNLSRNKSASDSDFGTGSSDDEESMSALNIGSVEDTSSNELVGGGTRYRTKSRSPVTSSSSTLDSDIREVPVQDTIDSHIQQDESKSSTPSRSPSPPKMADIIVHYPMDTRISDRIRNRRLPTLTESKSTSYFDEEEQENRAPISTATITEPVEFQEKYCECCKDRCRICTCNKTSTTEDMRKTKPTQCPSSCECTCKCHKEKSKDLPKGKDQATSTTKLPEKKKEQKRPVISATKRQLVKQTCDCTRPKCVCKIDKKEIPPKPTVALKSVQKSSETDMNRVQYYDHRNRFSKEYTQPESQVQKIPADNIETYPSSRSEAEFNERIYQRDLDAQVRGKKALEKERIHREYKELMQKLPALQRQERIASINLNNPTFHMGENRLKQHEMKKQCRMEDAYDKLFPNTVTIAPKKHVLDNQPFRTIDMTDANRSDPCLNVAHWNMNVPIQDGVTLTKDDGVITINANVSDQTDSLKYMLEKLKKQKEMLMKEVEALPRDSNLNSIISDLEKIKIPKQPEVSAEAPKSSSSTSCESDLLQDPSRSRNIHKQRSKSRHKRIHRTSSTEATTSAKKKVHQKIKRIILQNTSTQTSPKITGSPVKKQPQKKPKSPERNRPVTPEKISIGTSPMQSKFTSEHSIEPVKEKPVERKDKTEKKRCKCSKIDDSEICEILIKIKDDDGPEIKIKSPSKSQKFSLKTEEPPKQLHKKVVETQSQPVIRTQERSVRIDESTLSNNRKSWKHQLSRNETAGTSSSTSYYSPPDFSKGTTGLSSYLSSTQQTNKKLNPRLITYIKKLLSMSRASVEDLGVSTATEISISSSLANSMQADPLSQLRSVMKFFNLSSNDLAQYLQYSEASSSEPSDSHLSNYDAAESTVNQPQPLLEESTTQEEVFDKQLADAAKKYQNMANQCQERISSLTAAIQKVRLEKMQILSPSFSDKENSTAYMNLPSQLGESTGRQSPALSSSSEREQLEIDKKLLSVEVDMAKLRLPSPSLNGENKDSGIDDDIYRRYRKLVSEELDISQSDKSEDKVKTVITEPEEAFVPMLLDIPRLPKLPFPSTQPEILNVPKRKPPPAKGITAAKKFNGNITTTAHELSTIVEVDSQLRIPSMSPEKPNRTDEFQTLLPDVNSADDIKISEESMPDIVAEISSGSKVEQIKGAKISDTDSSEKSDMDNIEAMLISMGMGWAVATLKKTQQALIQTASTSSDTSKTKENMTDSSSDVTLRDLLGKKLFNNSSGTSNSGSPFLKEFEEISVIQGSGLSIDNRHHRTSTPVQKSSEKSKDNSNKVTFSGESELSSVKTTDDGFATIPNYSELPDDD